MMVQRSSRFTKGTKSNVKLFLEKFNCFIRKYAYVSKNSNKVARNKTYGNLNVGLLLGPVYTYSEIFAIFSSIFKKNTCLTDTSFSPVYTKSANQWKYDSIPHGACVMLVVNDARHHCILKHPFLSLHT